MNLHLFGKRNAKREELESLKDRVNRKPLLVARQLPGRSDARGINRLRDDNTHEKKMVSTSRPFHEKTRHDPREFDLEQRIYVLEKKMDKRLNRMGESFSNILVELRRENEEIRRDRQFLLEKMKNILLEMHKENMYRGRAGEDDDNGLGEIAETHTPSSSVIETGGMKIVEPEREEKNPPDEKTQTAQAKNIVQGKNSALLVRKHHFSLFHRNSNQKQEAQKQQEKQQEKQKPSAQPEREANENATLVQSKSKPIETPLDELLQLVMKKGIVRVPDAAKQFNVKEGQVEEWARILEEHDLIELHYPTFGRPVMKKKQIG